MSDEVKETCPRCKGWIWHRAEPCNCRSLALKIELGFIDALAARLKATRQQKGLSLDQLAFRADMSKAGLWQIEAGRSEPMAKTIVALAKALDVTTDYLLLG